MVLSPERATTVVELARRGYSLTQIQVETGVSRDAIKRACRLAAVELQRGRRPNQWTQQQIDECIRLYKSGLSELQIQKRMGVTQKATSKYLRAAGVPSRGRGSSGAKNGSWRGGRVLDKLGYVLVYAPDHPYRNRHNKVREHRLVMEQQLGRYLKPTEVVDHINGNTSDNRPENLRVFQSNAEHLRVTLKGRRPKWREDPAPRLAAVGRVAQLRRRLGRSTLCAVQLQPLGGHRCRAGTCPLFDIQREARLQRQRAWSRAWRIRERERRLQSAA